MTIDLSPENCTAASTSTGGKTKGDAEWWQTPASGWHDDGPTRRLTGQQTSGAYATFTYDSRGNLTKKHHQGSDPITMSYDAANRITTMQDGPTLVTQTYDDNGNLTNENRTGVITTWAYDDEDRQSVETPAGVGTTPITHTYSGDGLRRTMKVGAAVTTYVWDGTDYLQERT